MEKVKLGKYQHFKGQFYEVIGIGRNTENMEEMVVYKALYDSKEFGKGALWVRPKKCLWNLWNLKEKKFLVLNLLNKKIYKYAIFTKII